MHNKDSTIGNGSGIDQMYSCGRKTKGSAVSDIVGMIVIVVIFGYLIYRFLQRPESIAVNKVLEFTKSQEVLKMFISLLLLTNVKTLSNSMISNIILPLIKPVLPFLSCRLKIKVGLFEVNIGEFVSDILVFGLNMYFIYFIFSIIY
jgi:LytS/YehU family sensor histidine kinase